MDSYDVIVVGAGISGLSFAHHCLKDGLSTLVLEKSDHIGGSFHSHRVGEGAGEFWLELGAHTCYNSYRNLLAMIEDLGLLPRLTPRQRVPFTVLVDNQIFSILSQIRVLELLKSAPRIFWQKKDGESVESYYSKIVGERNYHETFCHFFNAVPSQRTNDFPADALFKKRERRKDILKSYTLDRGIQTLTDAVAENPKLELRSSCQVRKIESHGERFRLEDSEGKRYECEKLALATPPHIAGPLLEPNYPDLSREIAKIDVAAVESLGVVVRKEKLDIKAVAGIISRNDSFFSIVSRDTVHHEEYRGFTFHFKPDLLDEEAKLKRVSEVLKLQPAELDHVVSKKNVVPSLRVGHYDIVRNIDAQLSSNKNLLLTGNYFAGVAIEDCASRSRSEFERLKMGR